MAQYSIPIAARNIQVNRSLKQLPSSASADRSGAPGTGTAKSITMRLRC
jgi:hypothetical protein